MRKCSSWWYFSNTSLSLPSYIAWNLLYYGEKKVPRDSLVILDKNIVQYLVHVYVRIQQQSTFFNIKIKYFLLLFIFEVWTSFRNQKHTIKKISHLTIGGGDLFLSKPENNKKHIFNNKKKAIQSKQMIP